jgi:hypothetical protein
VEEGSVRLNVPTTPLWLPAPLEQRRMAAGASMSSGPADPSLLGRDGGPLSRRSVDSGSCHMALVNRRLTSELGLTSLEPHVIM